MVATLRVPLLLLALLANLISCHSKQTIEVLRLAQTEDLYSWDPDRAADAQSRAILSNLYEALVEFDADLKIRPALATSWTAPDEVTWIFEIRKNVKFHDGGTLTAADVKASFERVGGPGIHDPVLGISGIDILDDSHIRLRLVHPSPLLLNRLTQILIVPKRFAEIAIENPVGTGPYKFLQLINQEVQMEAFSEYWRTKPTIQRVTFSPLPAKMIFDRFAQAKLDVYRLLPAAMANEDRGDMRVSGRSGLAVMYLWFNCASLFQNRKNPFGDVRVRQAVSLALDRNTIVQKMGGRHIPADQLIPDGVFGFMPEWKKQQFDPDYSRKLMWESGHPKGFETTLAHPRGESYGRLVGILIEMLEQIGIRATARPFDFSQLLEARRNQELPFFVLTWTFDDGDAWTFLMASLHSKGGPQDFRSTNAGYSNPVVDRLIQESQQSLNIDDISRHYDAILKIAISESPLVPLYRRYDLYGVSPRVRFQPRLDGKLLAAEMQLLPRQE